MVRTSNEVLKAMLKAMHEDVKDIKEEVKLNTEFRHKASGIIGAATFVGSILGGFFIWIAQKIWK